MMSRDFRQALAGPAMNPYQGMAGLDYWIWCLS